MMNSLKRILTLLLVLILTASVYPVQAEAAAVQNASAFPEGTYVIESALGKNKVLTVEKSSKQKRAGLVISTNKNTKFQTFKIKSAGKGYYTITCTGSSMNVDVQGGSSADRARIQQFTPNSAKAQKWTIRSCGSGWYNICSSISGKPIDIKGGKSADGTPAQLFKANKGKAQKFRFVKVESLKKSNASGTGLAALKKSLDARAGKESGIWSYCVIQTSSGKGVSLNDRKMTAASLIKLYVAGAYYQAVKDGRIRNDYENTVRNMIVYSDNEACNKLIDLVGMKNINQFIQNKGFSKTRLNRKMLAKGEENYTSAKDCARLLQAVLNGKFVSSGASASILKYLKAQTRTGKIPAGVPSGVKTANKTGELAYTENDAAIVWGKKGPYIIVILSDQVGAPGKARTAITNMSRITYDAIGK